MNHLIDLIMKIFSIFFLLFNLSFIILFSQPGIQWQKSFGGTYDDYANSIQQTFDGGYIIAGFSSSFDGDITGNHGNNGYNDFWIIKLDSVGIIQWQKSLGGTAGDGAFSIQQTTDGGYVVAGFSNSVDGDVTVNHGSVDSWVVKLDSMGVIQWQRSIGGTNDDLSISIQQATDGGYAFAGRSDSNDGDVTGNHGLDDYWIVKLDSVGIIQWQRSIGGTQTDQAQDIDKTIDGGFVVAGYSSSINGDLTGNHGGWDYWVVKLDSSGTIEWQKAFGGTSLDLAYSIQQTSDKGYIVAGTSNSNDSDVTGNHGDGDYWIVKLDSVGTMQWQKSLGGSNRDIAYSIKQAFDNGFVIAGVSNSNDGDVTGNHGLEDYWIVKLDSTGVIQWQKSFGGTYVDVAYSIRKTSDEGYVVAGYSTSNDGDVTGNHGFNDYWIVKFDSSTTVNLNEIQKFSLNINISPNPFSNSSKISFQLFSSSKVSIEIQDIGGRLIKRLDTKNSQIGYNEIVWNATNTSGDEVDNGLYLVNIISNNFSETKKIIVLRN